MSKIQFKSKKDATIYLNSKGIDTSTWTDLDWLKCNKGQAEIHMMALAESMWDAYNESKPVKLEAGQWHIPFENKIDFTSKEYAESVDDESSNTWKDYGVKLSTAMCARTSYTVVGDEKEVSYETLLNIHDRMATQVPFHASPFEHCAKVMNDNEFHTYYGTTEQNNKGNGWCRNYKGFIMYRELLENK